MSVTESRPRAANMQGDKLLGRVAFVTGGTRGIGAAIGLSLANLFALQKAQGAEKKNSNGGPGFSSHERVTVKADGSVVDDDLMGGQYGVSISDSIGAIGSYRYLLFVTSRTEDHDDWGNTFYSEIDVIDAASASPSTKPAASAVQTDGK